MKKSIAALTASVLLLAMGCQEEIAAQPDLTLEQKPETKILVTLGDSISAGYGLDAPETQRYSAFLTEMLHAHDENDWRDCNYAVSGDDSSDLLQRLYDGKAIRLPAADEIVIYIGANNLLFPYKTYIQNILSENSTPESQTAAKKTLDLEIDKGLNRLEADLDTMYQWIRERNTVDEAPIYLLNIYNPYADLTDETLPSSDVLMREYAEEQITRCNQVLSDFAAAHDDIHLVDIAEPFAQCGEAPILGEIEPGNIWTIDPHPNTEGQKIIAETIFSAIKEYRNETSL